jgi:excisionase family DNA binding protein
MAEIPGGALLTIEEAAAYLRVDPKTVYRLINANELKAVLVGRVYRIDPSDLQEFVNNSKIKVQSAPKKKY